MGAWSGFSKKRPSSRLRVLIASTFLYSHFISLTFKKLIDQSAVTIKILRGHGGFVERFGPKRHLCWPNSPIVEPDRRSIQQFWNISTYIYI